MTAPQLEGEALAAVRHRGSHLQIIASAGSGKTEVVSQRVVALLAEGIPPSGIVAFTFTERAAEELKNRIGRRVEESLGRAALDLLSGLFIGTIHAYCFRLLQQHVPRYETFDVLDDNQLTAFLSREATRLDLKSLDPQGRNRLFASVDTFLKSVDVVENELLDPDTMDEPFRSVLVNYLDTLERYRLLTYGQQIAAATRALEDPLVRSRATDGLRHLIVDEYQDVNPAQERLIELLAGPAVELCVVGDDDQAIYQWRGSDVGNIVNFTDRYPGVATFQIVTNRRSRPQIVERANRFASTIPGRLPKEMQSSRPGTREAQLVTWVEDDELSEAGSIANLILELNERGVPFRDIAVLVRTSAAYPKLVDQFATFDIPVQPGGRLGLFEQPEAVVLGKTFAWLVGYDWRSARFQASVTVTDDDLLDEYTRVFDLDQTQRRRLYGLLTRWRDAVSNTTRVANLVGEFYELLLDLGVSAWDLEDTRSVNRLGTLARFTALLADYESVRRRARPDAEVVGEQVGGQDRGVWYYRSLATHIVNYATGKYEGFDGEPDFDLDAVDLTTIHRAKGLEWPVVFVPSLTAKRFPSSFTGRQQDWLVGRERFPAARYEGSDADERRLFYVAQTRARDWLSLSRHGRVTKQAVGPSPYWSEHADLLVDSARIQFPEIESGSGADDGPITITYSELAVDPNSVSQC